MTTKQTTILYRPVGQKELDLIRQSNWKRFPPRLYWQPIFYPVLTEEYAIYIAEKWNTKDSNSGYVGYVLQFEVEFDYIERFEVQKVGGRESLEYWIPAEELDIFNNHIAGTIQIIHEFRPDQCPPS